MNLPSGESTKTYCAILCADIVNYSRLTEENEGKTHELLTQRFKIINNIVSGKKGTTVRMRGDSVMAIFPTTEEALYCATEIQTAAANLNNHLQPNERIHFRVGISYGQVMLDEGEPYGNEVNVTARLQELATPDGIYLSEQARNQLTRYIPFTIEYVARTRVANIKQPMKIYKISSLPRLRKKPSKSFNKWLRIQSVNADSLVKLSIALSASSLVALVLTIGLLVFEYFPEIKSTPDHSLSNTVNQQSKNDSQTTINKVIGLDASKEITNLLAQATSYLIDGRLILPEKNNALNTYHKVLELDDKNKEAHFGIQQIYQHYLVLAKDKLRIRDYKAAAMNLEAAQAVSPEKSEAYMLHIQLLGQRHTEKVVALNEMQQLLKKQYENKVRKYQLNQVKREEYELVNNRLAERNQDLEEKLSLQLAELKKIKDINQVKFSEPANNVYKSIEDDIEQNPKILLNVNISKSSNVYNHDPSQVSQWLTNELSKAISIYNRNKENNQFNIAGINTNLELTNYSLDTLCSNDKLKDVNKFKNIVIEVNLLTNGMWWDGLQLSVINCGNKFVSKAFIPSFTPQTASMHRPWISSELRSNLNDIMHTLIEEVTLSEGGKDV